MTNYELVVETLLRKFDRKDYNVSQVNGNFAMQDNDVVCVMKPLNGCEINLAQFSKAFTAYLLFLNDGKIPFDLDSLISSGDTTDLIGKNRNIKVCFEFAGINNSITGSIFIFKNLFQVDYRKASFVSCYRLLYISIPQIGEVEIRNFSDNSQVTISIDEFLEAIEKNDLNALLTLGVRR